MAQTVLVAGLGSLGSEVTARLASVPGIRVVGCDVDDEYGRRTCNSARLLANHTGQYPEVEFSHIDLSDVDATRAVLEKYNPDLVFQNATSLSNRVFDQLPDEVSDRIYGAPGMGWLAPLHLRFPLNLARALEAANMDETFFVNASFPDLTNAVLNRMGYEPDCGVGNVGTVVPLFERAAAERLGEPQRDVTVFVAMPHKVATRFWHHTDTGGYPFYLKVLCRGEDVTAAVDSDEQLRTEGWPEIPDVLEETSESRPLVAASAEAVILGMLWSKGTVVHGPAPNGELGGWPFRVDGDGAEVVLPRDVSRETIREINREGMRLDGVADVKDDGTVVYTKETRQSLAEAVGFDHATLPVDELAEREREIQGVFDELASEYDLG